jgi:hypothetical protein
MMGFPTSSLKARLAATQRFVEGHPADEALYRFWLCARVARDLIASGEIAEAQKYAKPMQRLLDEGLPTCGLPTAGSRPHRPSRPRVDRRPRRRRGEHARGRRGAPMISSQTLSSRAFGSRPHAPARPRSLAAATRAARRQASGRALPRAIRLATTKSRSRT